MIAAILPVLSGKYKRRPDQSQRWCGGITGRRLYGSSTELPLFPDDLAGLASAVAPWSAGNQGQKKDLSLQALDAVLAEYGE
jgi:hypothetical protein